MDLEGLRVALNTYKPDLQRARSANYSATMASNPPSTQEPPPAHFPTSSSLEGPPPITEPPALTIARLKRELATALLQIEELGGKRARKTSYVTCLLSLMRSHTL